MELQVDYTTTICYRNKPYLGATTGTVVYLQLLIDENNEDFTIALEPLRLLEQSMIMTMSQLWKPRSLLLRLLKDPAVFELYS
jgi:hypothetical protein